MWDMKIYNKFGCWWYEDDVCRDPDCDQLINECDNNYNATGSQTPRITRCPTHYKNDLGIRNETNNKVSKIAYQMAGSSKKFYDLPKVDRINLRCGAKLSHLLNTAPAEEVITHMESTKSEFGQSKPMTKRTVTKVEGERVPEGWVYLVRNPDVPSIVKIGKTYPDGIGDIMSSARRFGRAELIHKCWFSEAYRAEQSIHKVLIKYNLRVLGYTDCGKELFECSIDIAMSAILAERGNTEDAA
jgi:hypothetical protein